MRAERPTVKMHDALDPQCEALAPDFPTDEKAKLGFGAQAIFT
jgi:hypothetical protein